MMCIGILIQQQLWL